MQMGQKDRHSQMETLSPSHLSKPIQSHGNDCLNMNEQIHAQVVEGSTSRLNPTHRAIGN